MTVSLEFLKTINCHVQGCTENIRTQKVENKRLEKAVSGNTDHQETGIHVDKETLMGRSSGIKKIEWLTKTLKICHVPR